MPGKLEPLRRILAKKPLIYIRDLFVQMAWRIDPELSALKWEILDITLSSSRRNQSFSWMKYDQLYRQVLLQLRNDKEWRFGPEKSWSVAQGPLNILSYLGERGGIRVLDFGCGGHFSDSTGLILYLCGVQSVDCLELERVMSGFDSGAALELVHWVDDELLTSSSVIDSSGIKIDEVRLSTLHHAALPGPKGGDNLIPVKLITGDIFQMNWEDGRYDLVTSNAVLEHVTDPLKIWAELKRLVKVGGILHHIIDFRDHRAYYYPDRFTPLPMISNPADWSDPDTNGWRYLDWLKMIEFDPTLEILDSQPVNVDNRVIYGDQQLTPVAGCEFIVRRVL